MSNITNNPTKKEREQLGTLKSIRRGYRNMKMQAMSQSDSYCNGKVYNYGGASWLN
jgi:hypothetical protein